MWRRVGCEKEEKSYEEEKEAGGGLGSSLVEGEMTESFMTHKWMATTTERVIDSLQSSLRSVVLIC